MQSKILIIFIAIAILALTAFLVERSVQSAGACESPGSLPPTIAVTEQLREQPPTKQSAEGHSCDLPTAERNAQLSQFGEFAAEHLKRVKTNVVANFVGDKSKIGPLLRQMIAAEANCCSFLQFQLEETADGYRVNLSADGGGTAEVADMLKMMSSVQAVR